jgi:type IVB pilus formation R64 PilN family outer membrane protein
MKSISTIGVCLAASALAGCAVTSGQVDEQGQKAAASIAAMPTSAEIVAAAEEPDFLRIPGNYMGSGAIPLDAGNALPTKFNKVSFAFRNAEGPLTEAAKNVREVTGLSVRLNPDVFAVVGQGGAQAHNVGGMGAAITVTPASAAAGAPTVPGLSGNRIVPSPMQAAGSSSLIPAQTVVPLNFSGALSDYLNLIAASAGVSWEYNNGEVSFFRLVTRSFNVDQLQQTIDVTDVTNGGGQTTLGTASSGANGGGSSTASNASTTALASKIDPWTEFVKTVQGMLSPAGRMVANPATGTFVVTDTKPDVERIGAHIAQENVKLRTRVDIEIRTITFELNDATNIGADFGLIYKALGGSYTLSGTTPAVAGSGGLTPSSITYTNAAGGRFNRSTVSLSALDKYGKVVSDKVDTIRARNRAPAVVLAVRDETYLAQTTPATGGGTAGGAGVPGLTPGTITYGSFFTLIPSVSDNGTVTLSYSSTESRLLGKTREQTGEGATFQQITAPALSRGKNATDLVIPKGGTEITVSTVSDSWSSQTNLGFTGASAARTRSRTIAITLVTPYVLPGI